jgi:hypothetical protein
MQISEGNILEFQKLFYIKFNRGGGSRSWNSVSGKKESGTTDFPIMPLATKKTN